MLADAVKNLGDQEETPKSDIPKWKAEFKQHIDGMFVIAGDCHANVNSKIVELLKLFSVGGVPSIHALHILEGVTRPGDQNGHEQ